MYIVRNTFTARPGNASKLAKLLKEVMAESFDLKVRIMTDHVGPMNTVVMEIEANDIHEFEQTMKSYGERADVQAKMKGYTELYERGIREIFRVV